MRVQCLHGYFIFTETKVGQVADFVSHTGLAVVPKSTYFTFESLVDAPEYSFATKDLLGLPATETFEGKPWEVFEQNGLVYNFMTDLMVPISSVISKISINSVGNKFISPGLILPGSLNDDGDRIKNYTAWFSRDRAANRWLYSEVEYV